MKRVSLLAMSLLFIGVKAQAIFDPSWERPILQADMTERDNNHAAINLTFKKTLTLQQRDGQPKPTTMALTEERLVYCIHMVGAHCPPFVSTTTQFKIESVKRDSCGSITYVGRELMNGRVTRSSSVLTLKDHSHSLCDMAYLDMWVATLKGFRIGQRLFTGKPEGVITIQ